MAKKPKGWKGEPERHSMAAMKGVRRRASNSKKLYGKSNKHRDALLGARRPGKRKSAKGNVYYEYRRNHAD